MTPALSASSWNLADATGAPTDAAPVPLPPGAAASTPIVLALWAVASLTALVRVVASLFRLRHAKRSCSPFPADRESALQHWTALRGTSRTRLMLSCDVRSAAVLGIWSPVVAINPALLETLDDEELDQIIVHELAHVERRDHGVHVIERLILVLFGWHPAIWWIGRQLRLEREAACDDRVVSIAGSSKRYAACLVKLGAIASPHADSLLAPAALTPQLSWRILRLLDPRRPPRTHALRLAGSVGAVIVVLTTSIAAQIELVGLAEPLMASGVAVIQGAATDSPGVGPGVIVTPNPLPPASEIPSSRPRGPAVRRRTSDGLTSAPAADQYPSRAIPQLPEAASEQSRVDSRSPNVDVEPLARLVLSRPSVTLPPLGPTRDASQAQRGQTPWGAAADTGVAIGRGSQKAAVATAGFFTRMSKSIAGTFTPSDARKPGK